MIVKVKLSDIYHQAPNLSLFHEDFAINANITIPDFDPRYAKVVGTMDAKDVWGSGYFGPNHTVFAFRNNDEVEAFIIVDNNQYKGHCPLTRLWSNPKYQGRGYVTALVQFVLKKLKLPLCITSDEGLTTDGWQWVIKAVGAQRVKVADESGTEVSVEQLTTEFNNRVRTKTELFFEQDDSSTIESLFGTGYRTLTEMTKYIGDERLD
jgi:hypothetical protein